MPKNTYKYNFLVRGWPVVLTAPRGLGMGWLRLVGSLKLYVSFAKEPYKRDYILQKRPMILRSLLIVATPYLGPTWVVTSSTWRYCMSLMGAIVISVGVYYKWLQ